VTATTAVTLNSPSFRLRHLKSAAHICRFLHIAYVLSFTCVILHLEKFPTEINPSVLLWRITHGVAMETVWEIIVRFVSISSATSVTFSSTVVVIHYNKGMVEMNITFRYKYAYLLSVRLSICQNNAVKTIRNSILSLSKPAMHEFFTLFVCVSVCAIKRKWECVQFKLSTYLESYTRCYRLINKRSK